MKRKNLSTRRGDEEKWALSEYLCWKRKEGKVSGEEMFEGKGDTLATVEKRKRRGHFFCRKNHWGEGHCAHYGGGKRLHISEAISFLVDKRKGGSAETLLV